MRIREFQSLNSLDLTGDYAIIIGHGVPEGLETNGKTTPWNEVYTTIKEACPQRAFVLACYSPMEEEIVGFNAPIDAKAGALLISWMIHSSLESIKQINFCVEDIVTAQSEMKYPLNRYLYFVHGYFGSNDDFLTMRNWFIANNIEYSYSEIRYFDYFEHYGLQLPDDLLQINALHYTTSISEYATHFAYELTDLPSGSHVSIVSHSMGGIITREMLGLYRDHLDTEGITIDKVITLGTPNHGTWIANPINSWAFVLSLMGGVFGNYGQYWPSPVYYSVCPISPLIINLNADPMSYSYDIEWYTGAGIDTLLSPLVYAIHFDQSDPLVAVGRAHLSFGTTITSETYDGISHMGLIQNDGSSGTFFDVLSWLCAGDDDDGDGLTNDAELYTWNTNPYDYDSDNDALSDFEEVIEYNTDPNNPNSDGDAINDGTEIAWNYDPLDSSSPIQASSLIQSWQVDESLISVTARSLAEVSKVEFYVQYKDSSGTWTSYQYKGSDSSAPFTKSWTFPSGYAGVRIMIKAYNSGNIYLGCDIAYQYIDTGGGKPGGDPVPI